MRISLRKITQEILEKNWLENPEENLFRKCFRKFKFTHKSLEKIKLGNPSENSEENLFRKSFRKVVQEFLNNFIQEILNVIVYFIAFSTLTRHKIDEFRSTPFHQKCFFWQALCKGVYKHYVSKNSTRYVQQDFLLQRFMSEYTSIVFLQM